MSESRPAYGEYASPEEQARRMGAAPNPPAAPSAPQAKPEKTPIQQQPEAAAGRRPLLAPLTGARRVDRIIATLLVLWGLISVVQTIPALTDLPSFFYDAFDVWGVDAELSDPSGARWWGVAAAFVLGIGWLLTALVTWLRTRRGRIVFWMPLVGVTVSMIVVTVLVSIPLAGDAALMQSLMGQIDRLPAP